MKLSDAYKGARENGSIKYVECMNPQCGGTYENDIYIAGPLLCPKCDWVLYHLQEGFQAEVTTGEEVKEIIIDEMNGKILLSPKEFRDLTGN